MPLLARRNKQQATSNKARSTKFRSLLVESLELRQLFAFDLSSVVSERLNLSSNGQSADFSSLEAAYPGTLQEHTKESIDASVDLSRVTLTPQSIDAFRATMPSLQQVQSTLFGAKFGQGSVFTFRRQNAKAQNTSYSGMKLMRIRFEFPVIDLLTKLCVAIALSGSLFCSESFGQKTGDGIPDRLVLKPENGPWFVMAKSYRGPEAKKLAEQLANELRKDFQLKAYCVSKKLDYSERIDGVGFDENGNGRRMKFRDNKVVEGYTVLVGDFDSIDSPAITETLSKIKRITPSMMANGAEPSDPSSDTVSSYRNLRRKMTIIME
jgi:hypothetical protein